MKTRLFSSKDGDIFLCEIHKDKRISSGERLGVPASAMAYMMGLKKWPTGNEPCVDCDKV